MTAVFQSFETSPIAARGADGAQRCARLRERLRVLSLDGMVVPRADRHQNEYVAAADERLAWLTGFTGSAGLAIVLLHTAALFVDGRYTLAVRTEVDVDVFTPVAIAETTPETWLAEHQPAAGLRIGYDPWLHTPAQIERLARSGAELVALDANPLDAIWTDRPAAPDAPIDVHPLSLAGEAAADKIARIGAGLGDAEALLLSDPHAVAWCFNIRGRDVAHTPLSLSYALLVRDGRSKLYLTPAKASSLRGTELADGIEIAPAERMLADLEAAGARGATIVFDSATIPVRLVRAFEAAGGRARIGTDPVALAKACKNEAECTGARQAQQRDGVAVVKFLHWLEGAAATDAETEISAAEKLEEFRRATGRLKDVSFPTISAAGPHGAIVHYRVTRDSDQPIGRGLFLVDSGGQYEDGTTDITRTVAIGQPDAAMRACFTRVLKGHIAIARAVFPKGTTGAQIDAFARRPLWEAGLDFDHGTGHGVGSYLSVHEGPQRISKLGHVPLEPGMILSNEPGFYREGCWGIRLENLVLVEPRPIVGGERSMYGFETLTLAPFDRALIDPALLDGDEIAWLDTYHARVRQTLTPQLDAAAAAWLDRATTPLSSPGG